MGLPPFLHENVPRQLDLLAALAALSDRCDVSSIVHLFGCISLCNSSHPVIVHAKSSEFSFVETLNNTGETGAHGFSEIYSDMRIVKSTNAL